MMPQGLEHFQPQRNRLAPWKIWCRNGAGGRFARGRGSAMARLPKATAATGALQAGLKPGIGGHQYLPIIIDPHGDRFQRFPITGAGDAFAILNPETGAMR